MPSVFTSEMRVLVDTNVLVALIDARDKWHDAAQRLHKALKGENAEFVYFDCVIVETVSVLVRRAWERKRATEVPALLDKLVDSVPKEVITWLSGEFSRMYEDVVRLVKDTQGRLNFHDAFMALSCRDLGIKFIASFDEDFDEIEWLVRIAQPDDLARLKA